MYGACPDSPTSYACWCELYTYVADFGAPDCNGCRAELTMHWMRHERRQEPSCVLKSRVLSQGSMAMDRWNTLLSAMVAIGQYPTALGIFATLYRKTQAIVRSPKASVFLVCNTALLRVLLSANLRFSSHLPCSSVVAIPAKKRPLMEPSMMSPKQCPEAPQAMLTARATAIAMSMLAIVDG